MHMRHLACVAFVCGLIGSPAVEPRLIRPDRTKHLVLDERVIQSTTNAKLTLGAVEKDSHNPLFRADQPWENALNNLYPNVLWDEQEHLFKLWYKCVLHDKDVIAKMANPTTVHDQGWFLLYATSRDGLKWEKPALGQFEFDGSKANNAVTRDTPNVGVFKDPHDADPARRYKMIYDIGLGKMRVRFSPDGVRWTEPLLPTGFTERTGDTHSNAFWDERLRKYVLITRFALGERLVARYESDDFLKWEKPQLVLRSTPEEAKKHQTYCMPTFPYANGYLGYVMMIHVGSASTVDCELAWSPDSVNWRRLAPGTPFIPRGPKDTYDSACIYAPAGPAIEQNGKLLIYYGGDFFPHLGWKRYCLPCLARIRVDGFAGYEPAAPESEAVVVTQPLRVTGPIQLTADAPHGTVRVRVLDAPAFGDGVSTAITTDVTDAEVQWPGRDAATLRGKTVRLKFELRGAKLYAFRGLELVAASGAK